MQIGAVFPQFEIGNDVIAIRDYIQAVEAMGYTHLLVYDHVLGASTATRPDWTGVYTSETPFHEVFVLLGYAAAITTRLKFVTDVLILPQRQTALVAKQTAAIDVLSGGRLRLGIGIGWNKVEYECLNEDFGNRGKRSEEQIEVLRLLWTNRVLSYEGRWHHIDNAGINPLPVQQPIPIWIGGEADVTLERIGRIGDGWFPQPAPDDVTRERMDKLRAAIAKAGRKVEDVGIEPRLNLQLVSMENAPGFVRGWEQLGATHMGINTMSIGLNSPDEHVKRLRDLRVALADWF